MTHHRIAVIGGTGPQGKGLGYRFARHGHTVVLGSRAAEKAVPVAAEVTEKLAGLEGAGEVLGAANADACADADVVLLAVPYDGHDELVATLPLDGKIVISCVNPLAFDKRGAHGLVVDAGEGSAAESAQRIAPGSTVVGAFHHVSAVTLFGDADYLDHEDVLVCGDDLEAKEVVMDARRLGHRSPRHRRRQAAPRAPARAAHRRADLDQPALQDALRASGSRASDAQAARPLGVRPGSVEARCALGSRTVVPLVGRLRCRAGRARRRAAPTARRPGSR